MRKFYLVARNKEDNTYRIIKLKENAYKNSKSTISKRANDLEAIDLLTSRYTKEQLIHGLYESKIIPTKNIDLFITRPLTGRDKKNPCFYEILYKGENTPLVKEAAEQSMNGEKKKKETFYRIWEKSLEDIQNENNPYYFSHKGIHLPEEVKNYLLSHSKDNFLGKYSWVLDSYTITRNIVEAVNRRKEKIKNEDILENIKERKKIFSKLREEMDPDFIEGQLNIEDYMNSLTKQEEKKEKEVVLDKKEKYTEEEKKKYIINTLHELDTSYFETNRGRFEVNVSKIQNCDDDLVTKYMTSLTDTMTKQLYQYVLHYQLYMEATRNFCDTMELDRELRYDLNNIYKMLSNKTRCNKLFEFCSIINYHKKLGEERNKVIGKK